MGFFESIRGQSHWDPRRPFLEDSRTGKIHTYGDLDRLTAGYALQLRESFGVKPGDRVAVRLEKSSEAFFLYLGCLRAGAIYLPLNPTYGDSEIDYFLQDAEPVLFVDEPSSLKKEARPSVRTVGIGDFETTGAAFRGAVAGDTATAAILYTSGTTGRSKGAEITHRNLFSNAMALAQAWGFTRQDRLLHALPIFHVHGLFISMGCVLGSGASAVWLPKFDADALMNRFGDSSVFMGVPTYYTRLLESPKLDRGACKGIRLFVSGSAPLRAETFSQFERRTGHAILERYGMTETGVITSNPLPGPRKPGGVGLPLPGVEVRLGEGGMIEVRGENVFSSYWRKPEQTRSEFHADGFFKTGDIGEFDRDGHLRIVGRAKDLIITGGLNVYPKEIEQVLDEIPGVLESAVFGVNHADFGEAVIAAVVPSSGVVLSEEAVLVAAKRGLAGYKMPKKVVFLPELPRNTMGKVQKNLLRERYVTLFG